ncbi:MAG: radical SAM protein [Candidatus Margulisiibacteriota bacterium]
MNNFIFSWLKRLRQIAHNLLFFSLIGKLPYIKKALQLDITSKCNLRCQGCYHFSGDHQPDMSDKEVLAFLEDKAKKGYKKLWVFGGEPTLRINLFDKIDEWFLEIHVISNGIIKIPQKFNWRLWISIDGPEAINDIIRGKGTYQKIIENYANDKRVGLVMTVNSTNYQFIPAMVNLVKEIGVHSLSFTFFSRCHNQSSNESDFSLEDLKKIEEIITNELKNNAKYLMIDAATLKSVLYGKISAPKWHNRCYFADVLIECYNSSGQLKKCCTENVICDTCRILPPHQFHCLMATHKAPWWQYVRK